MNDTKTLFCPHRYGSPSYYSPPGGSFTSSNYGWNDEDYDSEDYYDYKDNDYGTENSCGTVDESYPSTLDHLKKEG